jgi:predicted ATP-binding protein involved in virulence
LRCSLRALTWSSDPTKISGIAMVDEIDVHLHPVWQCQVIKDFRQAFPNLQLIASTHSPLVVGALKRDNVQVLLLNEQGEISMDHPEFDPQGLGAGGVLTSVFGLSSTIDQPTLDKITRRLLLYSRRGEWTSDDEREYEELSEELSKLGFNREFSDPYFEQFAVAMSKRHKVTVGKLTPEENFELGQYADKLLASIIERSGR